MESLNIILAVSFLFWPLNCDEIEHIPEKCIQRGGPNSWNDCAGNTDRVTCAFCTLSSFLRDNVCVRPYINLYRSDCSLITDSCSTSPCAGMKGEGYGNCRCGCRKLYYGVNCDLKKNDRFYTSGVTLLVATITELEVYTHMFASAWRTVGPGEKFLVTTDGDELLQGRLVFSDEVQLGEFEDYCLRHTHRNEMCQVLKYDREALYEFKIQFPYRTAKDQRVMRLNGRLLGYLVTLNMEVYNEDGGELLTSELTQRTFVKYPDHLFCVPYVEIINCNKVHQERAHYLMSHEIALDSKVVYLTDGVDEKISTTEFSGACKPTKNYKWEAWRERPNMDVGKETPDYYFYNSPSWVLAPFTVRAGIYYIRLTVRGEHVNVDSCYLEVRTQPLRAVIDGGHERSVMGYEEVVFDARGSYNPNVPKNKARDNLRYTWECDMMNEPICHPYVITSDNYKPYIIEANTLHVNTGYTFTLTLELEGARHSYTLAEQRISVLSSKRIPSPCVLPSLGIVCDYNCQLNVNPQDIFALKVQALSPNTVDIPPECRTVFQWTINRGEGDANIIPLERIQQEGNRTDIIIISEHGLGMGNEIISVRLELPESKMYALYELKTAFQEFMICKIEPDIGIAGVTLFNVACATNKKIYNESYTYEFYETHFSQDIGDTKMDRLIAIQQISSVSTHLTTGSVKVLKYDQYGFSINFTATVEVSNSTITIKDIIYELDQLSQIVERKEVTNALKIGSIIPDLLKPEMSRDDLLVDLVSILSQLPLNSFMDHRMCTFAVRNALVTIKKRNTVNVTLDVGVRISDMLLTISRGLLDYTKRDHTPAYFTFSMMHETISYLLDWVDVIMGIKDKDMLLKHVEYTRPNLYFKMNRLAKNILASFKNIERILILHHLPSQSHRWIENTLGSISMWTKVDDPVSLSIFELGGKFEKVVPVTVSKRLASYAVSIHRDLGLSFVYLEKSPLWWHSDVNTYSLDIQFCFKKSQLICNYPRHLPGPLTMNYNGTDVLIAQIRKISGLVHQLDYSKSKGNLDEELKVFKLQAPLKAKVYVDFEDGLNNNKLLVEFRVNYRPNYTSLSSEGVMINASLRNALTYDPEDEDNDHYMALMPIPKVAKSETVNFTARIYYKLCKTWRRGGWRSSGCKVSERSTRERLVCECSHLSMFAAQLAAPYIREETLEIIVLEPVQTSKILPLVILPSLLALYMVGCFFAWLLDHRDKAKRYAIVLEDNFPREEAAYLVCLVTGARFSTGTTANIYDSVWLFQRYAIVLEDNFPGEEAAYLRYAIVLEDNFPGEEAAYLVCVVTGARYSAGTTANVGIRLFGESSNSRCHILDSTSHGILNTLGEDWFLIYHPEPLGVLRYLFLWHDNTGLNPEWFCERIIVYDLDEEIGYFFNVHKWLSMQPYSTPQLLVIPSLRSEVLSTKRVFLDNLVTDFRIHHLWLATLVRHPRDPVTRVDRLTIVMCYISVAMLSSLLLIKLFESDPGTDDTSYSVGGSEVALSFFSFLISSCAACVLMTLFRKNYKITFSLEELDNIETPQIRSLPQKETLQSTNLGESTADDDDDDTYYIKLAEGIYRPPPRHKQSKTYLRNSVHQVAYTMLEHKSLVPVQLPNDAPNVYLNRFLTTLTWSICILTIICCVVVCFLVAQYLGNVKILKWITIFTFACLLHAFFYLPLKILLVSLLFAVTYKKKVHTAFHMFDPNKGRNMELMGNKEHLENIMLMRHMPRYLPIMGERRKKEEKRMKLKIKWAELSEFLMILLLLIVLEGNLRASDTLQYHTNSHVRKLMSSSYHPPDPVFTSVFNRTDYETFLQTTFLAQVYKFVWYNVEPISYGHCSVPEVMARYSICAAPWSGHSEDTRDHLPRWLPIDQFLGLQISENWTHTDPAGVSGFWYYGTQGYPPGGYIQDLGMSREETQGAAEELSEDNWADHFSRAIIVQLTLYNANVGWFTELALVVEQTVTGQYLPTILAQSVRASIHIDFWSETFFLFVIVFIVRLIGRINAHGLRNYFNQFFRLYELLMSILAGLALYNMILHQISANRYVAYYLSHSEDDHFNFYKLANYAYAARTLLCVLFILSVLRLYSLWRFGAIYFRFFNTFQLSRSVLLFSTLIFLVYLCSIWRLIGYSLSILVDVVFNPNMFFRNTYLRICDSNSFFVHRLVCFLICYSSVILMALMVCVFSYEYKIAKSCNLNKWNTLNFLEFTIEEIKSYFRVPERNRYIGKKITRRLRWL